MIIFDIRVQQWDRTSVYLTCEACDCLTMTEEFRAPLHRSMLYCCCCFYARKSTRHCVGPCAGVVSDNRPHTCHHGRTFTFADALDL